MSLFCDALDYVTSGAPHQPRALKLIIHIDWRGHMGIPYPSSRGVVLTAKGMDPIGAIILVWVDSQRTKYYSDSRALPLSLRSVPCLYSELENGDTPSYATVHSSRTHLPLLRADKRTRSESES